jgi:hypothetical protein
LISLPAFAGAGSACCARAKGAGAAIAMIAAKPKRMANRDSVMSISSVCVG